MEDDMTECRWCYRRFTYNALGIHQSTECLQYLADLLWRSRYLGPHVVNEIKQRLIAAVRDF